MATRTTLALGCHEPIRLRGGRKPTELPKQPKLVPTVPALDHPAVNDTYHDDPRNADRSARCFTAEAVARVCAFKDDAGGNFVSFHDRILDVDPRIRECRTHVPPERFEFGRSVLVRIPFT